MIRNSQDYVGANLFVTCDDDPISGDWVIETKLNKVFRLNDKSVIAAPLIGLKIKKVIKSTAYLNCKSECHKSLSKTCICPDKVIF
jgi:hypothetical protein